MLNARDFRVSKDSISIDEKGRIVIKDDAVAQKVREALKTTQEDEFVVLGDAGCDCCE